MRSATRPESAPACSVYDGPPQSNCEDSRLAGMLGMQPSTPADSSGAITPSFAAVSALRQRVP